MGGVLNHLRSKFTEEEWEEILEEVAELVKQFKLENKDGKDGKELNSESLSKESET